MTRLAPWAITLLMVLLYALAVGPSCPQEDSCRADYRDGSWHIEAVQP
jgi:hypothetical protein